MNNFDQILNNTLLFIAQKGWAKNEKAFFDSLSLFLANTLNITYVIIDKLLPTNNSVETLSYVANGKIKANVSYKLVNTPCENVMGKTLCCYRSRIQDLFPNDLMLVEMQAESYIGIPLWDTKGEAIGLIALLDTKPIEDPKQIESILQIVAVRVAHEIERYNFEKELLDKNKKLEESDRLKTAFLANMSHEIRTPMNAIMGFAELLKTETVKDRRTNFIDIIEKRCADLLRIINDLLDISRIESNQLVLTETEVNLNKMLIEISSDYLPILQTQKPNTISFHLNIDRSKDLIIYTDPDRLKQVIINLVSNAFKFTVEGNIELGYIIDDTSNSLKIYIKDTGIGIHPSNHKIIFERFRQADEQYIAQNFGGTGLGLSITKGIVELMNGSIGVDSEEGKGSTFYFYLPMKPANLN